MRLLLLLLLLLLEGDRYRFGDSGDTGVPPNFDKCVAVVETTADVDTGNARLDRGVVLGRFILTSVLMAVSMVGSVWCSNRALPIIDTRVATTKSSTKA